MTDLTSTTTAPEQQVFQPLALPELTREQARVSNDFCNIKPVNFAVGNHHFSCNFSADNSGFCNFLTLSFSLAGQELTLDCDQALTALLVENYLPEEALLFLPETLRIATVQAALAPFVAVLQQATGIAPQLGKAPVITRQKSAKAAAGPGIYRIFGQLHSSTAPGSFCLDLPQDLYQQLLPLFVKDQQINALMWQQMWQHIPLSCPLVLAQTSLSTQQLALLQHRDVVFFDTCYYREQSPVLRVDISEQQHCLAVAGNNGLTVQEIITNLNGNNDMSNEQIAMNEIPVTLTFEAGNLTLPLGELNQLSTGHVFAFDTQADAGQEIQIRANGQLIGACTLVSVAGKLGAQITRLNNATTAGNTELEANGQAAAEEALPGTGQDGESQIQEQPAGQATQE